MSANFPMRNEKETKFMARKLTPRVELKVDPEWLCEVSKLPSRCDRHTAVTRSKRITIFTVCANLRRLEIVCISWVFPPSCDGSTGRLTGTGPGRTGFDGFLLRDGMRELRAVHVILPTVQAEAVHFITPSPTSNFAPASQYGDSKLSHPLLRPSRPSRHPSRPVGAVETRRTAAKSTAVGVTILMAWRSERRLMMRSAVAVERVFSGGRDTISLRRASSKADMIKTLMFVKARLRWARKALDREEEVTIL
ncbi:hypothetical protein DFH08DRAFT_798797 [Mycena albidolilacea]|uniref:HAT C-terminal dimerisation domain-containing protein n=1 Tax=Mycena albidolilacea TaxID=1033008 RepID=A0AAD7APE3_9AGAR|nr:hypothetical protein DFH08DRAFT_798797 [Mycena albidolilacea]